MTNPESTPNPEENPYGTPQYGSPQGGQEQYGQPQYGQTQPQYGAPQPGQPQYGTPQYGAPQYGTPQYGGAPGLEPDNNLVWAILATVLCCLPLGIVSIVKATSVSGLWARGDYAGAQQAADDAKKFAVWSAIAGVVVVVVAVIVYVVLIAAAVSVSNV